MKLKAANQSEHVNSDLAIGTWYQAFSTFNGCICVHKIIPNRLHEGDPCSRQADKQYALINLLI